VIYVFPQRDPVVWVCMGVGVCVDVWRSARRLTGLVPDVAHIFGKGRCVKRRLVGVFALEKTRWPQTALHLRLCPFPCLPHTINVTSFDKNNKAQTERVDVRRLEPKLCGPLIRFCLFLLSLFWSGMDPSVVLTDCVYSPCILQAILVCEQEQLKPHLHLAQFESVLMPQFKKFVSETV